MTTTNQQHGAEGSSSAALADFAAAVHRAIRTIGSADHERYGARKVFISAIASAMGMRAIDAGSLQRNLLAAHRAGLLSMARADMVAAMPSDVVAASQIADRGATFHFVIDQGARDPWEVAS